MEGKIYPDKSIIEALSSESPVQTPFSRIPGFVKQFAITQDNKEELISILSSLAQKEIKHLESKISDIQNEKSLTDPALYNKILEIEGGTDAQGKNIHSKLIGLAKEIIASEMGLPVYSIFKNLDVKLGTGTIDQLKFDNPHTDTSEKFSEQEQYIIQQEQQVRTIINALIMGAGHRIFDKLQTDKKYPKAINKIDPDLYQSYYDMVYTNLKSMWETPPSKVGGNHTGSMQLINEDNGAKIKIQADIFPVMLHEMAKGVVEYLAYTRYNNLNSEMISSILSVDSRESEHWMMLLGPQIYKQLFFLIKEAIAQYNEENGILDDKQESDYILPVISHIIQLAADQFLSFMETILRQDQDGQQSIESIKKIIDAIHSQYEGYLASNNTPKMKLTIKEIMEQLTREFSLGKKEQQYIKSALPDVQDRLEFNGYSMSDKKLAKKITEHYLENRKKFQLSDMVDQSWLTEVGDALQGFKKSRIEQAAFGLVHEQQKKFPKWTKNHAGESINIHPRFPLSTLEEAKKNINPKVLEDIDNQVKELIQGGSITDWLKDHDDMSTLNANLTERFITLDSVTPECVMQREGNRGLYELTTLEQLKRESGSMGSHCVADFIDSIKHGSLRVFSLRLGTKSRWTIGYEPGTQTINQVKGYTNQIKNSVLKLDDPDYQQVIDALVYLSQYMNVKKINDISVLYEKGFLLTNKGLMNPDEFVEKVRENGIYEITLLQENKTMNLKDVDILEKLNLNNVKNIRYQIGGAVIMYSIDDQNLSITRDHYGLFDEQKIAKTIAVLFGLKKHPFFVKYDGYPVFLTDGIKKDDNYATVTRDGKYGVIKKEADGYKEIIACIYEIAPWFTEMGQAIIKKNGKFGVLREDGNDNRVITIPCEYDEVPKFSVPGLMENEAVARKDKRYGLIREDENKMWIETLPCIYDRMVAFGANGLDHDESRVRYDDTLPFGDTGTYGVIKRSGNGFEEILECKYDDLPNFGTDGLSSNEARVKRNGKYGIIKKEGVHFEEVLDCKYDSIPDNQPHGAETYGLLENEYIVYQDKKWGAIGKNKDGTWSEIIACEYDMISGTDIFNGDVITIVKDKKFGFIKRENEKFIEILPCEYEKIGEFGVLGLSPDEATIKKNGKYGIIKIEKEDKIFTEILPCEYDSEPVFGDNILQDNEVILTDESQYCVIRKLPKFGMEGKYSQAKVKLNGKEYIWKKNDDNARDEIIYEKYEEIKFKETGLQVNEARVKRDKKWGIIRDNKDGTWMPILQCKYNSVELGFSENTKIVSTGDYSYTYGIIQKNDNGTRTEVVACEYQEIQCGIKGLGSREVMVKGKIGSGKGIIKIDIDGKLKEIVPCSYDGIIFGINGLGIREAIVFNVSGENGVNRNKYGAIKISEDDTFVEILPCEYDEIKQLGNDCALVLKDKRSLVLQKNDDGVWTRFFSNSYDEILQFATGGLGANEAVVRDDKQLAIIRRNKNGVDKKIISDYIMKDFGMYGLQDAEARAKKKGQGMGIIKRNKKGEIKELLPCIYDAIGEFGDSGRGLQDNEVIVMKDGKCGIVKRAGDGYQEVLACQYYSLGMFGENGLTADELWAQEHQDGNYTIIIRTENGYKETGFYSYTMRSFDFGKYGLLPNESFLSFSEGEGNGIVRKNIDGTYDTLLYDDYAFDLSGNREGLLPNEYRATNVYGGEIILRRKTDGLWEEASFSYYEIFPLGENDCNDNEAIVRDGESYGIIKRNTDGKREEIVSSSQYYFDENFQIDGYDFPFVFFPDLLDGKRLVLAVQEYAEKVILLEDEHGKFVDVGNTVQWLRDNPNFKDFFSDNLTYLPF
ncbi:MAG: WG repeat-containing protein [Candidatus Absconditicoccaceae bacterium]